MLRSLLGVHAVPEAGPGHAPPPSHPPLAASASARAELIRQFLDGDNTAPPPALAPVLFSVLRAMGSLHTLDGA